MTEQDKIIDSISKKLGGLDSLGKSVDDKVSQPTNKAANDSNEDFFHVELLLNKDPVTKTITDGYISVTFRTITGQESFEIDQETDATVYGTVSNNVRKMFRYCCASLKGLSLNGHYTDFSAKNWREREEFLLDKPTVLINKLIELHKKFEVECSKLFTTEKLKNS